MAEWSTPAEDAAKAVAGLGQLGPGTSFRFCKVTSHSGTAYVTIDYGGVPMKILKASIYIGGSTLPPDNSWVCVGVNGSDRFILGVRTT